MRDDALMNDNRNRKRAVVEPQVRDEDREPFPAIIGTSTYLRFDKFALSDTLLGEAGLAVSLGLQRERKREQDLDFYPCGVELIPLTYQTGTTCYR